MKKSISILLFALLTIPATYAFAKDETCPDVYIIRDTGSNFTHAYKPTGKKSSEWVLSSDPFEYNGAMWQTHYVANMDEAKNPADALNVGQNNFDHSTLITEPNASVFGTDIRCFYAPSPSNYFVMAVNQVGAGFTFPK